jgi:hypothetical protein
MEKPVERTARRAGSGDGRSADRWRRGAGWTSRASRAVSGDAAAKGRQSGQLERRDVGDKKDEMKPGLSRPPRGQLKMRMLVISAGRGELERGVRRRNSRFVVIVPVCGPLVQRVMNQARPRQAQSHDQGEAQCANRRPPQERHGPSIIASVSLLAGCHRTAYPPRRNRVLDVDQA